MHITFIYATNSTIHYYNCYNYYFILFMLMKVQRKGEQAYIYRTCYIYLLIYHCGSFHLSLWVWVTIWFYLLSPLQLCSFPLFWITSKYIPFLYVRVSTILHIYCFVQLLLKSGKRRRKIHTYIVFYNYINIFTSAVFLTCQLLF